MTRIEPLARLTGELQKLPGIGAKSAQRLAFHLLKRSREEADQLCDAIRDVKERVVHCSVCSNITDCDPCFYCTDAGRDRRLLCVVEDPHRRRDREDRRVQGHLPRADGGPVAPEGHRTRRPAHRGAARRVGRGEVAGVILASTHRRGRGDGLSSPSRSSRGGPGQPHRDGGAGGPRPRYADGSPCSRRWRAAADVSTASGPRAPAARPGGGARPAAAPAAWCGGSRGRRVVDVTPWVEQLDLPRTVRPPWCRPGCGRCSSECR